MDHRHTEFALERNVIDWAMAQSTASQVIKLANDLRFIDKEMS